MCRPVYGLSSRRPLTLDELDSERASDWRLSRLWVQHGHSLGRFLPSWRLTPLTCKQIPPFLHHRLLRGAEERAEATSLRDGNPGTMRQAGFCTREGGRCQRRRADGWAKGSEMDGQLLLFRPPPCQASVIKAIHHPPWGGGSLPCSDTTASFSVVHHSGERGVGEQGRGRGSQREPAQQTAKAAPLRRPRPAPNAGSVHWLRPRARHSYWGLRVVVSADEAPWKQG